MYDWDDKKDEAKRRQYGFEFQEVMMLFSSAYYSEPNDGYPGQHKAIGYTSHGVLVTVAYEDRSDEEGQEMTWLATFWKASPAERKRYEEG